MKLIILLSLLVILLPAAAQEKVFTADELMSVLEKFHPLARKADVDVKIAKAEVLSARDGFDPRFKMETGQKEFGGITYYYQRSGELNIPAWYGVDFFAGREEISGSRINPEETRGAVNYAGLSVQPLQHLLMDKRRAVLLQARNFHLLSQVQRKMVWNDLVQEALYSYWDWWKQYQIQRTVAAALMNAGKRLALVRTAFQLGERPAIDTLEAYTQVQSLEVRLSESYQDLTRARLQLSVYLWREDGGQTELPPDIAPQEQLPAVAFSVEELVESAESHPALTAYGYKLKALQVDKRLAFQSLLPEVKLRYVRTGNDLQNTLGGAWFNNNYRYGVSFSVPLRLSKGRGDYRKAKLEIEGALLEQANTRAKLQMKVKQYYTNWQQAGLQLAQQNRLLQNMIALQRGEETRFMNGEGSLFLINAREIKAIEAEQKTIELRASLQQAAVGVRWAAGQLAF